MVSRIISVCIVAVTQILTAQTCPCATPATITKVSGPTTIITPSVSTITIPNLCTSCSSCISDLSAAQSLVDTVQLYLNNDISCGCAKKTCGCGCPKKTYDCGCNDHLILPPLVSELPYGVGFFEAAVPLVAAAYGCGCASYPSCGCSPLPSSPCGCGLVSPVTSSTSCGCGLTLPAPLFAPCGCGCPGDSPATCCVPDYFSLVRPVIL